MNTISSERAQDIMARLGPPSTWLLPRSVGLWRAAAEAMLGWFVLLVAASIVQPGIVPVLFLRPSFHSVSSFAAVLGWF